MEGYLKIYIKRKFSAPYFEKVWVVLDRQQLYYYQKLDLVEQTPQNIKGIYLIRNASVEKLKSGLFDSQHAIKVVTEDTSQNIILECGDPNICTTWFNALMKAVVIHSDEEERLSLRDRCCEQLRIDPSQKLTKPLISRTYKKLALQTHPDKGGDVDLFNKINIAYTSLMSIQANLDELEECLTIDYEAIVEKAGDGVGLGIVVLEDKLRGGIVVQSVQENTRIHGLTAEAEGRILPGDVLIAIDKDDCSHWVLSRVRARLNNFRVPLGSKVHFSFERRVPKIRLDDPTTAERVRVKERPVAVNTSPSFPSSAARRSTPPAVHTTEASPTGLSGRIAESVRGGDVKARDDATDGSSTKEREVQTSKEATEAVVPDMKGTVEDPTLSDADEIDIDDEINDDVNDDMNDDMNVDNGTDLRSDNSDGPGKEPGVDEVFDTRDAGDFQTGGDSEETVAHEPVKGGQAGEGVGDGDGDGEGEGADIVEEPKAGERERSSGSRTPAVGRFQYGEEQGERMGRAGPEWAASPDDLSHRYVTRTHLDIYV